MTLQLRYFLGWVIPFLILSFLLLLQQKVITLDFTHLIQ